MENEMTALSGIINEQAALRSECARKIDGFIELGGYSDEAIDEYKSKMDTLLMKNTTINKRKASEAFDALVEASKAKMSDGLNDVDSISQSVDIINTLNGRMDYEAKQALVDKFRGNQIALQAISNAFSQHGVLFKDLDEAIMNPALELAALRPILERAFMKQGDLSTFAIELIGLAERMGISVEMPSVKLLTSKGGGDKAMTRYGLI